MSTTFDLGFGTTPHELTLDSLPVTGSLPDWLSGTLLRNGPGTFQVDAQRYRHWFDGLAMLHKFTLAHGRVSYANKYLQTRSYAQAQASGHIAYAEFATDPCRSLFGRVMAVFRPEITDSAKVNLIRLADEFMALAETPIQVQFDPDTLRTVGVMSYEQPIFGSMTTVHPHLEGDSAYNLVTRYHAVSHYRFYRLQGHQPPRRVASVPTLEPSYLHSFGTSPRYFVVADFPLKVNPISLLLWLRPYIENFHWKPQLGTPFLVIDRHTGQVVARFESDAFFAFHHVNAFETADELVVDVVGYPNADIIQAYYLHRLAEPTAALPWGQLRRYRLPLRAKRGRVTGEVLAEVCLELPRFDEARYAMNGAYRYVYAVSVQAHQPHGFYNQLAKVDARTGHSQVWHAPQCFPGEAVFVGAPGRVAEDDGVVLSVVLDAARGTSFLLVLDAASFTERARAEIPQPVLFGYHGNFFA